MTQSDNLIGVALTKCFFCGEDDRILLNQILSPKRAKAIEEMHGKVIDYEPCNQCAEYMKQGIILIAVDEEKTDDPKHPYRTGAFWVVTEDSIPKLISNKEFCSEVLDRRMAFIPEQIARQSGLYDQMKGEA